MKILHVYKNYWPIVGGIENHVKLLARAQAERGHQVTVLVANDTWRTGREEDHGVQVIRAGCLASVASTPLSHALPWQLWRQKPDVTHLHFPYPVGETAQFLLGRSRATVLSYHSDVVKQQNIMRFYRPLLRQVMRRIDRILVATPNYLASSELLQDYRAQCQVLPYGIDRRPFLQSDPVAAIELRAQYPGKHLLVFVGVLRYYKGLQYLLEALATLPEGDTHLVLVGDGPMRQELAAQAERLGITDSLTFAGRVSDEALPLYYRAADVFILPASERSEAFGLVQVEAMSSGTPVISTELGTGTSYVNQDGVSGLVVKPKSGPALAKAIRRLLADDAYRAELARGAQQRSELFDAPRMVDEIENVYRDVLGARGSSRA